MYYTRYYDKNNELLGWVLCTKILEWMKNGKKGCIDLYYGYNKKKKQIVSKNPYLNYDLVICKDVKYIVY